MCQCLSFRKETADQMVDFRVPAVKGELVEVIQFQLQDCIQGRLAEQMMDFSQSHQLRRISRRPLLQNHIHEHIVEDTLAFSRASV